MPRKPSRKVASEALRDRLRSWANANGQSNDPYVIGLHRALEDAQELAFWSTLSPLQYLPIYGQVKASGRQSLAKFLAAFRNVIIFLPVALTWAAVGEATRAFNEFIQKNAGTPANFLQFWQDGYGVLDHFWSIGNVATIDFVIVALVISLTAVVAVMHNQSQAEQVALANGFYNSRRALAIEIEQFLLPYRSPSWAATELQSLTVSLDRKFLALGKSLESAATATAGLKALEREVNSAARRQSRQK
jgi:D-ribose pyranose/furanose isomerase RbsD